MKEMMMLKSDKVKKHNITWILLIPATLYVITFLIYPMINMVKLSFQTKTGEFTLSNYSYILTDPTVQKVFLETVKISLVVMLICLLLGYPVAYVMTICSRKVRSLMTLCIMIPFWTSLLVRTYAWVILLQNQGIVNQTLINWGIIQDPITMMYNTTGLVIGMTHVMLPYMILSLYSVMDGIDRNLVTASANLGANGVVTFFKVYFPLSLNGVIAGCVLVFVLNLGFYILPSLMGSPDNMMVSQMIATQVNKLLNWNMASALSFVLLAVTLILVGTAQRVFHIDKLM